MFHGPIHRDITRKVGEAMAKEFDDKMGRRWGQRAILTCRICGISLEHKDLLMVWLASGPRIGLIQGTCPHCSGSRFDLKIVDPEEKKVIGGV